MPVKITPRRWRWRRIRCSVCGGEATHDTSRELRRVQKNRLRRLALYFGNDRGIVRPKIEKTICQETGWMGGLHRGGSDEGERNGRVLPCAKELFLSAFTNAVFALSLLKVSVSIAHAKRQASRAAEGRISIYS
ncbi:uncharacterized protein PHALS_00890 [Plasmopara halstedii]|uniref:Uncharacterized protein n=1 Tax=Plasmopara halstedii TaxID=4781 RepID=A0A0P1AU60_PLAHL|nr:uncharacterized protein PHALS_10202 [Plasmopara halstedii]XP_024580903.1 uncharacterized protein PHALS_00890 [Plasmopara halstedii]CEG39978.1 hypothetical protein PHALS_10202 [Plasmopara halstedii]CEG44534.1 hypothetical protein PHALS_00890 [Plasmopara halstedii]|eukprot:XP_024576347.1 hypothetical protein PHALS_10202 [Plasmopara halstedii]